MLQERDDTYGGAEYDRYCRIVTEEGFGRVYSENFRSVVNIEEIYEIWWHPDGLLLIFNTASFNNNKVIIEAAGVFFNWERAADSAIPAPPYAGGGYIADLPGLKSSRDIFVGSIDVCEGLRYKLAETRANGRFLPAWLESPLYSLNHRHERNQDDATRKRKSLERLSKLPDNVKVAIGVRRLWEQTTPRHTIDPNQPKPEASDSGIGY